MRNRAQSLLFRGLIRAQRSDVLENEIWAIDDIVISGTKVDVRGWLLPIKGVVPLLTLNGRPFSSLQFHDRPDVADYVWRRSGAGAGGFMGCVDFGSADPFSSSGGQSFLQVSFANAPTVPLPGLSRDFFLLNPQAELPLPSPRQRARVLGNTSDFGFRLSGATDFRRMAAALEVVAGQSLDSFEAILDWGVGCGRIARYAVREVDPARFHGCDIDADNVAWCQRNLGGSFHCTGVSPPLPFADRALDLVYGVSVFTHMRESLQDRWLAELRRVLRPGGIALVTTHGSAALDFSALRPSRYAKIRAALDKGGLVERSKNYDLDHAVDHSGEYVNVYHAEHYIRRRWSRWFDILAVVPGYIFTHDLVVLRRP